MRVRMYNTSNLIVPRACVGASLFAVLCLGLPGCDSGPDVDEIDFAIPDTPNDAETMPAVSTGGSMTLWMYPQGGYLGDDWRVVTSGTGLSAAPKTDRSVTVRGVAEGSYILRIEDDDGWLLDEIRIDVVDPDVLRLNATPYFWKGGSDVISAWPETEDGVVLVDESLTFEGEGVVPNEVAWWQAAIDDPRDGSWVTVRSGGMEERFEVQIVSEATGVRRMPPRPVSTGFLAFNIGRVPETGLPLNGLALECFEATIDDHPIRGVGVHFELSNAEDVGGFGGGCALLAGEEVGPASIDASVPGADLRFEFEIVNPVSEEELAEMRLWDRGVLGD